MDPKEIHSQTIFFGKVHLRVSPDFRKRCAGYVERAKYGFRKSAELSGAERYRRLLAFWRHILSLPVMIIAELQDF